MIAAISVLSLTGLVQAASDRPSLTQEEFAELVRTCISTTGEEYEEAAARLDEVLNSRRSWSRSYRQALRRYNKTWQERWIARILLSRSANPQRSYGPGRTHRRISQSLRDPRVHQRFQKGQQPAPLALGAPRVIDPAYHASRRSTMGSRASLELPADVEFLWKLSDGSSPEQRRRAVDAIGVTSGAYYWELLGYDLNHLPQYFRSHTELLPDLGELLMCLLERESDAWVARDLQGLLAMIPNERVLRAVRNQMTSKHLEEPIRKRFADVVPVMEQYHQRLEARRASTTQPAKERSNTCRIE